MAALFVNGKIWGYLLAAVGLIAAAAIAVLLLAGRKKNKRTKEQEHQAQRRMREEALDRALANPMGKMGAAEQFEKQRRPFKVEYSPGERQTAEKSDGRMFEISEITELSKRKYMFRCSELVSIGNQFGTILILPGTAEPDQIYCQLFYFQGANYVRSTGKKAVSLRRKGKSAVVNQNGIKLQSEDVVCVGTTMFQIVFLQ